jgi:3-methyladenine DNA glycosylase AlkC
MADAMHSHLPQPFPRAARVLVSSLGPEHESTEVFGMAPLRYMPHVFFVQKYGLEDFEASMHAQYELTKRFSAESSIRAFLVRYPEATYARLIEWSTDPNPHVRRLVSEGSRPRLPWAPRLRAFQEDPAPVLALLDRLKDDPVRYVQRSVANNLNDIGKDHPDVLVATCRRWSLGATNGRSWIVKHALRSLVKKGHRGALLTLGVGAKPKVSVGRVRMTRKVVRIGDSVRFSFVLRSRANRKQELEVDYAVHFVKANGTTRPKVFKLQRLTLERGAAVELGGRVSFAPMTTRRPFPGKHHIELLINGVAYPLADVRVSALRKRERR